MIQQSSSSINNGTDDNDKRLVLREDECHRLASGYRDSPAEAAIVSSSAEDHAQKSDAPVATVTYLGLIRTNRPFRFFFLSYLTNHLGEWLTYVASISALESLYPPHRVKTFVSILIAVRVFPFVILLPFGGVLADGRDKRRSMMVLDVTGAVVALLFVGAVRIQSPKLLFVATFVQECVSALYEPSRSSIVPLLAPNDDQLVKATYLTGMAWSFMAAFGSALGGVVVSALGIEACYLMDCATYLLSALFITCMGGTWDVSTNANNHDDDDDAKVESPLQVIRGMVKDGANYVWGSFFGLLVLIKPSMEIVWGAGDILSVSFSERGPEKLESMRLGLLFASAGVGCILGPILTDQSADLSKPTSIQRLCLLGMGLVSIGCFCSGVWSSHFSAIAAFTVVRAMGSSIVWVNSALLLQKFSVPEMLGRVTSIELAITLLANMLSALGAGALVDRAGWTPEQLSLGLAAVGTTLMSIWTFYHLQGKGAGEYEAQQAESSVQNVVGEPVCTSPVVNERTPLSVGWTGGV